MKSPELRYFHFQKRVGCVGAETEYEESFVIGAVRVIEMQLFGNLLNAENCFSGHFLLYEFVVGELEFVFQVVSGLEKLQVKIGDLLVQGLKVPNRQNAAILIQQYESYPLYFEEKGRLSKSQLLQTLFEA